MFPINCKIKGLCSRQAFGVFENLRSVIPIKKPPTNPSILLPVQNTERSGWS